MEVRKKMLGQDTLAGMGRMANLASTYDTRIKGGVGSASDRGKKDHDTYLGEHLVMLTSMANLALVFGSQGGWKEAEERVIEMRKKVLGQGI
jgi:tetratricopeptide repeat protein